MKNKINHYYIYSGIVFIILISLFILGSVYDLKIASFKRAENLNLAVFISNLGVVIPSIPLTIALIYLIKSLKLKNKLKINNIIETLIYFIIPLVFIVFNFLYEKQSIVYSIISNLLCLIIISSLIYYFHINKEIIIDPDLSIYKSIIVLITIIGLLILVNILKLTFNRPRPTNLELYRNWWNIKWTSWKHNSFPSGHTYSATTLLFALLLFNKINKKTYLWISFTWLIIIIVAMSRIVLNKHFLTDVVFSMLLSFTILTTILIINQKKGKLFI
ncbi:phosphatase PAP2 family protein [Mycoplasma mycoides]|uniref:phosphatase PAP2 family protein n=1 Tax=Mycoplasma mycoides TaxID=2102 RepID=UPI0027333C3A|nr:phosphatase PAP2 family protein [Mycoplasma mycoides]MDP4040453.1 phosphatase PAP2 family protein [Mycoplasma mycoides]MDP4041319.1 phosphatase PAP2 family protein [Mycoplasma mycoides]MDP4042271.1 phosphatase PAP2 family protein [Mycoplasma mycoides]MDP4043713.1 phosphatase PAP2 family protein [Mycoplasma mycoides]MDP4044540.1 phosphatase PAP2 family protein [Mycoplasma mycoides]